MITTAIITDGGIANRYMPYTKTIPKGMLPIGNKPVMHFVIEECMKVRMQRIFIVTDEKGRRLYSDYFQNELSIANNARLKESSIQELDKIADISKSIELNIIIQDDALPYGNGTPLLCVKKELRNEPGFLYLYSDNITFGEETSAEALMNAYQEDSNIDAHIAVKKVTRKQISQHASIEIKDEDEKIIDKLVEKPKSEEAPSLLASYGRYLLTNSIFEYLQKDSLGKNNELWTADAISKLAQNGKVKFVIPKNVCMTTGDPDNYYKTCVKYHELNGN